MNIQDEIAKFDPEVEEKRFNEPITITVTRGVVHTLLIGLGVGLEVIFCSPEAALRQSYTLAHLLEKQDYKIYTDSLESMVNQLVNS